MCVIERKTYYHTDGREETIERARPCDRAVGKRLCKHVDYRTWEAARIVETKPSSSITLPDNDRDGYIVTEGSRGQQRLYRDLRKRSSNGSSSVRRNATMSDRTTPISTPSSASSPSYVEIKPEAPSPPPAAAPLYGERVRTPYSSSKPRPSFTKDGTAIYERPPSMDQPRAVDNERPRTSRLSKEFSFSSITAEVDDAGEPTLSERRRRPSISIDTNARPATPSSGASAPVSSPGLSQLKSAFRRDSGKDVTRRPSLRHRADSGRQRRARESEEDERQTRLERDRPAESDRRQSTRDRLARDASRERRERHRREAVDTLEGKTRREDSIRRGRDAERAEAELERERDAQLRRDEELGRQQYYDDQLRRDAEARRRNEYTLPSRPQIRSRQPSSSSSPTATRSPITSARAFTGAGAASNTTSMQPMPPRIHQQEPPQPQAGQTISERGADVIARERARAAGQSLNEALGGGVASSLRDQEREAEEYQARMAEQARLRFGGSGRRYR